MIKTTSASYSIIMRIELTNKPGMLGKVVSAIGKSGGNMGSVDIVGFKKGSIVRDVVVNASDQAMLEKILNAVKAISGISLLNVADRTFLAHAGGKMEIRSKIPLTSREDLSMA